MEKLAREGFSSTTHNKAVAGKCGHEPMNKKLTKLENRSVAPEIATASYANRSMTVWILGGKFKQQY